jgi:hypothetical protein
VRRAVIACIPAAAGASPAGARSTPPPLRIATFNCSLNRPVEGGLRAALATPDDAQARTVAQIIQRVRPAVLLLQEFDYDAQGASLRAFLSNYLGRPQGNAAQRTEPIGYPYSFSAPSNTGVPSGFDLDRDGRSGGSGDALGFGEFPGQYGMVLLSRFPIDAAQVRTFRKFLWRDMPGALLPDDPATAAPNDWYSPAALAVLPLSSKSHWDVPVRIAGRTLHLLVSHPTPPAFDGPEDRNGRRNHDEIRFWSDYLDGARYIRDDAGHEGGFRGGDFVIMGDQNSDPLDGVSLHQAIDALIHHARIGGSFVPQSAGAVEAAALQGGANAAHQGEPRFDTADFNDRVAGNLRVDYLLPAKGMRVCDGGVFWPRRTDPGAQLVWGDDPPPSSDHRLVWIDLAAGRRQCRRSSTPTGQ